MRLHYLSSALILGTTVLALGTPSQDGAPAKGSSVGDASHPQGEMCTGNSEGGPGKQGGIHGPGGSPGPMKPGECDFGCQGSPSKTQHEGGGSQPTKGSHQARHEGKHIGRSGHGGPRGHGKPDNKVGPGQGGHGKSGGRPEAGGGGGGSGKEPRVTWK